MMPFSCISPSKKKESAVWSEDLSSHSRGDYSFAMVDGDNIWIANLGDSRAVLGKMEKGVLVAEQLTIDDKFMGESDRFIVFGTRGLWAFLGKEEAVRIVHTKPRKGIAKELIKRSLELGRQMGRGESHDDISVVVLFLDRLVDLYQPVKSVRGFPRIGAPQIPFVFK